MSNLKKMSVSGWTCLINPDLGYYPYLQVEWRERLRRKLAINAVIGGEAGIGKSFTAIFQARLLSKRFMIDDIVFDYGQYMSSITTEKKRVPIVFDEPQYDTGKHQFMKPRTRALVNTIMSQRFRQRPLFIPIINAILLDKSLRSYLVQYQCVMNDRGRGIYYRLDPSQMEDKVYRYRICRIEYDVFDKDLCSEESCLDCKKLSICGFLKAQYERKKAIIQNARDRKTQEESQREEGREAIDTDLIDYLKDNVDELRNIKGKIDVALIMKLLREKRKMKISQSRSYELRTQLMFTYPNLLPVLVDIKE